jgi:hypothetical protein
LTSRAPRGDARAKQGRRAAVKRGGGKRQMLTKGDDFPIHQTPEPIAFSGSDRNFYDRYFFNGMLPDGSGFFAAALGVYPHLNIADAHVSALRDGVQHALHASRILEMERMNLSVGPIAIEVIEPLRKLRLKVDGEGMKADLVMEGRSFPMQEPRFTRRNGPRMFMDVTRFTQGVRWSGWLEIDGKRIDYKNAPGVRDRSWGVRPIGAGDQQPAVPAAAPQFYWLWAPTAFPTRSFYAHVNEDAAGEPWNRAAVLTPDGVGAGGEIHLADPKFTLQWKQGRRHAQAMRLEAKDKAGKPIRVAWTPIETFQMKGIGYSHPEWGHGRFKGPLAVEREAFKPADLNPMEPANLHIQEIARARIETEAGAEEGVGSFEQLVIGPHAPSGFKGILDGAA